MHIEANKVVRIDYTLKNDQGAVLDSSEGNEPLSFMYGNGQIIPGLEAELAGKAAGDRFSVSLEPKDGYGEYDESMIFEVPRTKFQDDTQLEEGMQVQGQSGEGRVQVFTITSVGDENVTLDANHPLAGHTLHFDIAVVDVRDATPEELDHGHAH